MKYVLSFFFGSSPLSLAGRDGVDPRGILLNDGKSRDEEGASGAPNDGAPDVLAFALSQGDAAPMRNKLPCLRHGNPLDIAVLYNGEARRLTVECEEVSEYF